MNVQVSSTALLSVSDHASGEIYNFGALVGHVTQDIIVVVTCFEIRTVDYSVDWVHLNNRLELLKNVQPQSELLGIYQLNPTDENSALTVLDACCQKSVSIYGLFNFKNTINKNGSTTEPYWMKFYLAETHHPLKYSIHTTVTEAIAASTIADKGQCPQNLLNHKVTQKSGFEIALAQLLTNLDNIIQYSQKNPTDMKSNNLIAYLSNKILSYKNQATGLEDDCLLDASELDLLTSQLSALNAVKINVSNSIIKMGMNNG